MVQCPTGSHRAPQGIPASFQQSCCLRAKLPFSRRKGRAQGTQPGLPDLLQELPCCTKAPGETPPRPHTGFCCGSGSGSGSTARACRVLSRWGLPTGGQAWAGRPPAWPSSTMGLSQLPKSSGGACLMSKEIKAQCVTVSEPAWPREGSLCSRDQGQPAGTLTWGWPARGRQEASLGCRAAASRARNGRHSRTRAVQSAPPSLPEALRPARPPSTPPASVGPGPSLRLQAAGPGQREGRTRPGGSGQRAEGAAAVWRQ